MKIENHSSAECNTHQKAKHTLAIAAFIGLIIGIIQLTLPEVPTIYWIGLSFLALLGLTGMAHCLIAPEKSSAATLLGAAYAAAYGIGTINTQISIIQSDLDIVKMAYIGPEYISTAIAIVLITSSILIFLGNQIRTGIIQAKHFDAFTQSQSLWVGIISLSFAVILIATGKIGFNYNIESESGGVSALGQLALISLCPAAGITAARFSKYKSNQKLIAAFTLAAILAIQLFMGRRIFAFTLLTVFACYNANHKFHEIFNKKNIILGILLISLMGLASKAFMATRMASRTLPTSAGVLELVTEASRILKNPERSGIDAAATENQQERTFVIGYFGELIEKSHNSPPLFGELAKFNLAIVTPSVIFPGKSKYISLGFEETITHPHFGLPIWDAANSLFTTGIADFGIPGSILYPLLIGLLYSAITIILNRKIKGPWATPLFIGLFFALLGVEAAAAAYFITLRDLAFVCILLYLAFYFSKHVPRLGR